MNLGQPPAYPPISDYAFISDCHSCALVSRSGSIDWCCMPRIDSPSCFGRLLDWGRGGYWQIRPLQDFEVHRCYQERSLILETTFTTSSGRTRLIDFLPMREGGCHNPYRQLIRMIDCLEGEMTLELTFAPRFDYAAIQPWIRRQADHFLAIGGATGLLLSGDPVWQSDGRHGLAGRCHLTRGERKYLSILFRRPEDLDDGMVSPPAIKDLEERLAQTRTWWQTWTEPFAFSGPATNSVMRSAIVLKGLSNAPSGAIAAAATTSLPEASQASRNWDYRFSWARDSSFAVRSLATIGFTAEADGFRRFMERSCAGSAAELQILFGLGGERRLHEYEIDTLKGYRGAKPVRIGNAAETQTQLDVYGELLDLAWRWHQRGQSPDDDYWEFLCELIEEAAQRWQDPDHGIWEIRGKPRHFVLSKAMCWVALDRGIRLASDLQRKAPVARWRKTCTEIRQIIEDRGYDRKRGVFIQAFDTPVMDASLLLMPIFGFLDAKDERMVRTIAAIRNDLEVDGLLRRYPSDQLDGQEGSFLACTFWLAECLADQGLSDEARRAFETAAATANDLGLMAEEFDSNQREMCGNFPQALTHLSLIAAAVALQRD